MPIVWLGLLFLLAAAFSAASAKHQFQETALFRRRATGHSYLPNPVDDLHTKGNNPGVLRGAPMRPFANAIVLKRSLGNSNPANSKRTLDLAAARPMQDMKIAWQPMQIRAEFRA